MYFFITGQANPSKYRAEGQGSCSVLGFEPITFCSLEQILKVSSGLSEFCILWILYFEAGHVEMLIFKIFPKK